MGADDFWAGFGEESSRWAQIIAGGIMQRAGEKRAEQRQIDAEGRAEERQKSAERRQYIRATDVAKFEADLKLGYTKLETDYNLKVQKDLFDWTAQTNADLKTNFMNPRIGEKLEAWANSGDEALELQALEITEGMQGVMANQEVDPKVFEPLEEDAAQILEMLGAKGEARKEATRKQMESAARSNMYNAMAQNYFAASNLIKKEVKEGKAIDATKFGKAYSDLIEKANDILTGHDFRTLQDLASKGKLQEGSADELAYNAYLDMYKSAKGMADLLQREYLKATGIDVEAMEEELRVKLEELKIKEQELLRERKIAGAEELMLREPGLMEKVSPQAALPIAGILHGVLESLNASPEVQKKLLEILEYGEADVSKEEMAEILKKLKEAKARMKKAGHHRTKE